MLYKNGQYIKYNKNILNGSLMLTSLSIFYLTCLQMLIHLIIFTAEQELTKQLTCHFLAWCN